MNQFRWISLGLIVFFIVKGLVFYISRGDTLGEIFLWYCNISLLILALGFWRKSPTLVGAVFVTSIPAQSAWILDFFLNIIGSSQGLNRLTFFEVYAENPNFINALNIWLSVTAHGILIPLATYGVWKIGINLKAFGFYYWFYLGILLPISYLIGSPEHNINCMHLMCGDVDTMKIPIHHPGVKQMVECTILITTALWMYLLVRHYYCFHKKLSGPNIKKYLDPPK